jgi:hypothetical protein
MLNTKFLAAALDAHQADTVAFGWSGDRQPVSLRSQSPLPVVTVVAPTN